MKLSPVTNWICKYFPAFRVKKRYAAVAEATKKIKERNAYMSLLEHTVYVCKYRGLQILWVQRDSKDNHPLSDQGVTDEHYLVI